MEQRKQIALFRKFENITILTNFEINCNFAMRRNITPTAPNRENSFNSEMTDPSSTDPMFLSWGSSVNVCDELRRSIRSEIEEIDGSVTTLQTNVKNEGISKTQLSKDLSLARSEMINLCRGATDEVENAIVNEQIRIRMAETLKVEVLASIITPSSSPSGTSYTNPTNDDDEHDEDLSYTGKDMADDASRRNKNPSLASQISMYRTKLKQESENIGNAKKEFQAVAVKIKDIEDEIKRALHRIKEADLPSQLKEIERDVESKRQELESELQRRCSTKESIQRSMKRCGDFAQQIADKVKSYFMLKFKSHMHL